MFTLVLDQLSNPEGDFLLRIQNVQRYIEALKFCKNVLYISIEDNIIHTKEKKFLPTEIIAQN